MRRDGFAGRNGFPPALQNSKDIVGGQSPPHSRWVREKLTQQLRCESAHCLHGYNLPWGGGGEAGGVGDDLEMCI